jgi:uncharacterized protein YneF (UPF0154 family)
MIWLVAIGSFVMGFMIGKIAGIRRMSKWLRTLPESDQNAVRILLKKAPQ